MVGTAVLTAFWLLVPMAWSAETTDADYRVGAGDTLDVQIYGEPTMSGSFKVDDSGRLSFPLLGPVEVQGARTSEIAADLKDRLSPDYLVNPNVTVWVSAFGSQPVQVLGAVGKPGVYHLEGSTTLLELLSQAGGVSRAGVNEVRITHAGAEDKVTVVPYQMLLAGGSQDVALRAGDIVFVPDSLVSVMGEVGKPGEIAFREGMTVSQSIAAAGGLLVTGSKRRVFILRGEEQIRVNLRTILTGDDVDIVLEPGDRVFVKRAIF